MNTPIQFSCGVLLQSTLSYIWTKRRGKDILCSALRGSKTDDKVCKQELTMQNGLPWKDDHMASI